MSLLYSMYQQSTLTVIGLVIVSIWTLIWKGLALWHTGKNQQKKWFVAILILNTAGLLPIIYLLWFKPQEEVRVKTKKSENVSKNVSKEEKIEGEIIEISEDDLKDELDENKPEKKTTSQKASKKKTSKEKTSKEE